jgi:hypothetical protein
VVGGAAQLYVMPPQEMKLQSDGCILIGKVKYKGAI